MDELFSGLKKCDCGRPYCDYFAAGDGEFGTSYSKEELIRARDILNKALADE